MRILPKGPTAWAEGRLWVNLSRKIAPEFLPKISPEYLPIHKFPKTCSEFPPIFSDFLRNPRIFSSISTTCTRGFLSRFPLKIAPYYSSIYPSLHGINYLDGRITCICQFLARLRKSIKTFINLLMNVLILACYGLNYF